MTFAFPARLVVGKQFGLAAAFEVLTATVRR